ncbi:MAG: hypothetical protein ACPLW5_07035 [Candidatus Bathyarchaeales archaeon]
MSGGLLAKLGVIWLHRLKGMPFKGLWTVLGSGRFFLLLGLEGLERLRLCISD